MIERIACERIVVDLQSVFERLGVLAHPTRATYRSAVRGRSPNGIELLLNVGIGGQRIDFPPSRRAAENAGELQSLIEKHAQARSLPVQARVQLLGPMADTEAIRALDVPTFQPSGYSQVDDLNRERAAIYELTAEITRLAVVKEQMEGVAKALEVP